MSANQPDLRLLGVRFFGSIDFLTLERRHYVDHRGRHHSRVVVRHPGAVVVVPVIGEDVIMIRQHRVAVGKDLLELPAGKIEAESPEETARRECREEIGYLPRKLSPLHVYYSTPGFTDERMWVFLAEELEPVQREPEGAEEEGAETVRIPVAAALAAVQRGEIEDAKSIIGLYALAQRRDQ